MLSDKEIDHEDGLKYEFPDWSTHRLYIDCGAKCWGSGLSIPATSSETDRRAPSRNSLRP
eukprot:scaffold18208_cov182-Amphora_coffeaeformis.AAC.7